MAGFLNSVQAVAVVLLLTATGYVCARLGWLTAEGKRFLNKFVITLALPCACVYGLTTNLTQELVARSHILLLIPLVCIALNFLLAVPLSRRLPRKKKGVFLMMCGLSNSLFIGYPMCRELFGDECIPYVMLFYMVSTAFTQLLGLSLVRWSGGAEPFSRKLAVRFLTSPTVLGVALGYALVLCNLRLPGLVTSYCRYMNQLVSPLALLITGRIIFEIGLKNLRLDRDMAFVMLFRFLVSPGLFLLACTLLHTEPLARNVFVVQAAMPVVTLTTVAASEYGADEQFAARGAALTTLVSFLVIPVLMLFLQ